MQLKVDDVLLIDLVKQVQVILVLDSCYQVQIGERKVLFVAYESILVGLLVIFVKFNSLLDGVLQSHWLKLLVQGIDTVSGSLLCL